MKRLARIDRPLLFITLFLLCYGFFIFTSASLGLLARDGARFSSVVFNQVLGLGLGGLICYAASRVPFQAWRKVAPFAFALAIILCALVFTPLGFGHNGARRWLDLGFISLQPSEFLKISFLLFYAAWLATFRKRLGEWKYGAFGFAAVIALPAIILLSQPDNDTLAIMATAGGAMFFASGARIKHIFVIGGICAALAIGAYFSFDYVQSRVKTFLDPSTDAQGAGFQIQQSLIAIGSGELAGRGFGQSVQKFHYLPEPIGDSIFAVAAEEFGFGGSLLLVFLYLAFALRGFAVSAGCTDPYGMALGTGITSMIVLQSFMNISAMLGLIPLSGLPLLYVSHGGTAMVFTLLATGILFSVSRQTKTK